MPTPQGPVRRGLMVGLKLALLIGLLIVARQASLWVEGAVAPYLTASAKATLDRVIVLSIALYILLMTLPFVPGAEIGLTLMMVFGTKVLPLVYGGTVTALVLAYLIGRLVPYRIIVRGFESVRLRRMAQLLSEVEGLPQDARLEHFTQNASTRMVPFLLRHRYLAIMLALNMPGNFLIGGGGGICLVAGFSRLFSFPRFFLAIALAVAPVPLLMLLTG